MGDAQVSYMHQIDDLEPYHDELVERTSFKSLIQPQLRRSAKECHASQIYFPHEYVRTNDAREP